MLQLQLHRRSFPIPRASHSFTFHCAFSFASLVSSASDINITHSRSSFRSVVFFSFWSIHFRLCFSFFLYIFFSLFVRRPSYVCMYGVRWDNDGRCAVHIKLVAAITVAVCVHITHGQLTCATAYPLRCASSNNVLFNSFIRLIRATRLATGYTVLGNVNVYVRRTVPWSRTKISIVQLLGCDAKCFIVVAEGYSICSLICHRQIK